MFTRGMNKAASYCKLQLYYLVKHFEWLKCAVQISLTCFLY